MRAPQDSAGRPIGVADRVSWRGQIYTIKSFGDPAGRFGTRTIEFEEPLHVQDEVPDEIGVDLVQEKPSCINNSSPRLDLSKWNSWTAPADVRITSVWISPNGDVVVLGLPSRNDEEKPEDEQHNCDTNACGQDHVLARLKAPPRPSSLNSCTNNVSDEITVDLVQDAPRTRCSWCGGDCPRWGTDTCPLRPRQLPRQEKDP